MELSMSQYFTFGNIFLAIVFLLILNQLIELYQFRNMPPGPRLTSLPFIGNLLSFDSTAPGESFLEATASVRKKYGTVYSLKAGSFKVVFVEDTESVKEVLVKKSSDYAGRPPFYTFYSTSRGGKRMAAGYGPAWRIHRKIFMTAIRQYISDQKLINQRISEQATKLLQLFDGQNGKDFDPSPILKQSVVNVICKITFGDTFNSSHPDFEEFFRLHDSFFTDVETFAQSFVLDFFPVAKYFPFKGYKKMIELSNQVFEILEHRLEENKKVFDPSAKTDNLIGCLLKERLEAINENGTDDKVSMLSDDYILNTIDEMFTAGYETTSSTLRWVIAYLVHHPEYQAEIQSQLDEVVGRDRMPELEDRPHLPLVQATIMEALRLGNVAEQTIPHYTVKETSLAGYRVPKDTVVFVNLMNIHQDPRCWENPTSFNPHRHIDADGQLITNSGNFLPFSAGRRVCPGESLAKVEIFMFLSWMLHNFTFLPSKEEALPDLKGIFGLSGFPAPYKIRAVKR